MIIRLAIRGFSAARQEFEDLVEMEDEQLGNLLPDLAEKHAAALASHDLHMIEIEFLDERDPLQRFFRFGTDPARMVEPMAVALE